MENQDSEPLFGDDVYSLLRDDSLLHRTGSNNFASLIEPSPNSSTAPENHPTEQQQQVAPHTHREGQQQVKEERIIKQEQNSESPRQTYEQYNGNQHFVQQNPITSQQLQQQQLVLKEEHNYQSQGGEGPSQQGERRIVYQIATYGNSAGKFIIVNDTQIQPIADETQIQPTAEGTQIQPIAGGTQIRPIAGGTHIQPTVSEHQEPQQKQQQVAVSWDNVDMETEDSDQSTSNGSTSLVNTTSNNSFIKLLDECTPLATPDSTMRTVPSLQPWAGRYDFNISIPTDNRDRNKWCYSKDLKKLYVCPNVAVPVNVKMSMWVDATVTITPVFQQSQYRMDPVTRCYNCKSNQNCDPQLIDYIVQIDGEECTYEVVQDRPIVKVPLQQPPPGEQVSTLLVRLMCLTSCVGGPNRRPFCLVLTVHCKMTGSIIGRQILDVKCCKCPSRDLTNDSKANTQTANPSQPNEKITKIRKLSSQIQVNVKRKKPKVKPEPGTDTRYVNIAVPVEFELQVKSYVNGLIAEQILRHNQPNLLLYPEEEDN